MNVIGFTCLCCGHEEPAASARFTCPACGGNLDVRYDYEALRTLSRAQLMNRGLGTIFDYAALLPVRDLALAPPLRIGKTPLYKAPRLGRTVGLEQVYVKDDGQNPSASFKDRAGAVALVRARESGAKVIAGATTGNAGSSMACLSASVAMPCVIFLPEKAPPAKIAQLMVFGANVIAVRGTYDDAFDLCGKVCAERGWFNRNTGSNPFTREGKKTCSYEVWEQLGGKAPDWMIVCTGDGNIISGIWKGFRDLLALGLIQKMPRLVCAQSEESAAISLAIRAVRKQFGSRTDIPWPQVQVPEVRATTLADSISVDIPRDGLAAVRAVIETGGEAVTVPDSAIIQAIPELARGVGVFAEPAAAASWACLKKLAAEGHIRKDESVVCLVSGNGLKDVAGAMKSVGKPAVVDPSMAEANKVIDQFGL